MTTHHTHCALRLGDNICHLHFLRKLAQAYPDHRFVHAAHIGYLPQLVEVICDLSNVTLVDLASVSDCEGPWWTWKPRNPEYVDAWKNAGGYWETHHLRHCYATFYIVFFERLAGIMGLTSPISTPSDLLFDYPALQKSPGPQTPFDFLVINSQPQSGQCRGYNESELTDLVKALVGKGHSVITTQKCLAGVPSTTDHGLSVTGIGNLSLFCKYIVAVSTGPSWPTFNVYNQDTVKLRVLLLENERVNFGPPVEHVPTAAGAREILKAKGLL